MLQPTSSVSEHFAGFTPLATLHTCTARVSVQVLIDLPDNLLVSVLRSSQMPLFKQFSRLPHVLHMAALHAAYPSIAFKHKLRVSNAFSEQDAEALGRLFARLSSLQQLGITWSRFTDAGARALYPHLASLSSLQHLDMSENLMDALGASHLGRHLANLSSLQCLILRGNRIGALGARALGPHLAKLSSLQHLDISGKNVDAEGARALGPHLAKISSCLLYTSPSPRDRQKSRMPSSA